MHHVGLLSPPCNYAVNVGRQDVIASCASNHTPAFPADWRANGVFFNHYHDGAENPLGAPLVYISQEFITEHDGSSLTVMLSEHGVWCLLMTPNGRACNTAGHLELDPPGNANNYEFLRLTELDEAWIQ